MHWSYLAGNDDVITTRPHGLWLYLHFYKVYYNQTWEDDGPTYTGFTLYVKMTWSQLCHVTKIMAFPPLLYSQNNQTWNNGGPACTDITLQMMITSLKLDHVVNVPGFLSTFISPIKTKFGMMVD